MTGVGDPGRAGPEPGAPGEPRALRPARVVGPALLALVLYSGVFLVEYRILISPQFAYAGLLWLPLPLSTWVALTAFTFLPLLFLPLRVARPSDFLVQTLFVLLYLPSVWIPPLVLVGYPVWIFDPFLLVSLFVLSQGRSWWHFRIPACHGSGRGLELALWLFLAGTVAATVVLLKSHLRLFSPEEVYAIRSDYKDALRDAPFFMPYLIGWSGNVVVPFLSLTYVRQRRWLKLAAVLGCLFLLFLRTSYKSMFFGAFLVFILFHAFRRLRPSLVLMLTGMAGVLVAGWLVDTRLPLPLVSTLVHRRLLAVPGQLAGTYFTFFAHHPFAMLAHSFFRFFLHYPYAAPPANLMGYLLYDRPDASANTGIWGDAYANFGLPGMLGFSLAASFVFRLYDEVWKPHGLALGTALLGVILIALANSPLFTVLLTHGLLFALLLGLYVPVGKGGAVAV